MAACVGLGLAGLLPWDASEDDVRDELRALASLGLSRRFYEVIGERVFCCERNAVTEVLDPKLAAKLCKAWKAKPGADLRYEDWDFLWEGGQVFIPGARPPRGTLTLPRLGQRSYRAIRSYIYRDADMPAEVFDSVLEAYNAAHRHKFLFTVSG